MDRLHVCAVVARICERTVDQIFTQRMNKLGLSEGKCGSGVEGVGVGVGVGV
jgi:hypothetical protein